MSPGTTGSRMALRAIAPAGTRPARGRARIGGVARVLGTLCVVGVLSALLAGCHPLINPLDPNSTTYTGVSDGGGGADPPDPLLPPVARWEIAARHFPDRMLPLRITDDGSFVEPRLTSSLELWITLSDSFERNQTDGAVLWIAVTNGVQTFYTAQNFSDVRPDQRRLVRRLNDFSYPFSPSGSYFTFRLTDRNGTIIGEQVLGYLIGDVDGNGQVEATADRAAISDLAGFSVSTDDPATIRADLDCDGFIEPGTAVDTDGYVVSPPGASLPPTPASFWD